MKKVKGNETEKREGETKILKRVSAGSRGWCHKRDGEIWNPLANYVIGAVLVQLQKIFLKIVCLSFLKN